MAERLKILLVEDNVSDARLLCRALDQSTLGKFDVASVSRLDQALSALCSQKFDAVILDLFLPDSQGLETLKSISKSTGDSPIIVLTGLEDEAIGVEAIRTGAEEYLLKAEVLEKSVARIILLTIERRRTRGVGNNSASPVSFRIGALEMNLLRQEILLRLEDSSKNIYLTPIEFKILALLARNRGVVLPRSRIVAEVWGDGGDKNISVRTLDKHVSSLKKKCSPVLTQLHSVYGVGYSLDNEEPEPGV